MSALVRVSSYCIKNTVLLCVVSCDRPDKSTCNTCVCMQNVQLKNINRTIQIPGTRVEVNKIKAYRLKKLHKTLYYVYCKNIISVDR